jgi:hypothetical protein
MSRKRTYNFDWDKQVEDNSKHIMLYYVRTDDEPRVIYFSTEEQSTTGYPGKFRFMRENSSWVLINNSAIKVLGVYNNNDHIAENILNELNRGETDEATTLEIKPFTYNRGGQHFDFPGYTYESSHNPILKGGRRRNKKSRRKGRRSRRKSSRRRRKY